MKDKKALSGIVTTIILVAMAIGLATIVWVVVDNIVKDKIEGAEACLNIFGEVNLNPRYTCYDGTENKLQFSISIGDLDVQKILVAISSDESSTRFELDDTTSPANVASYPDGVGDALIPGKNSGLTYIFDLSAAGFIEIPKTIDIAPIINGNTCEVSDSIEAFDSCDLL